MKNIGSTRYKHQRETLSPSCVSLPHTPRFLFLHNMNFLRVFYPRVRPISFLPSSFWCLPCRLGFWLLLCKFWWMSGTAQENQVISCPKNQLKYLRTEPTKINNCLGSKRTRNPFNSWTVFCLRWVSYECSYCKNKRRKFIYKQH